MNTMPSDIAPAPTEHHDTIRAPMLPPPSSDADERVTFTAEAARPWSAVPATELLEAWIGRSPAYRCVDRLARIEGRWCIELRARSGVFTSLTQETIDSAIRCALMVAMCEGER